MYDIQDLRRYQDIQFTPSLRRGMDFFENILLHVYESVLSEGDCAIDGGANRGIHSVPMAKCVGQSGVVLAFEALPHLARQIHETNRHLPQLRVVDKALSDSVGSATYNWIVEADGLSGLAMNPDFAPDQKAEHIQVDTVTLDFAVPKYLSPKFIKLDIEGNEYYAFKGAERIMTQDRPIVIFENSVGHSEHFGYTFDDMFGVIEGRGYVLLDLFGRDLHEVLDTRSPVCPWYKIAAPKELLASKVFAELPEAIRQIASEMTLVAAS